MDCVVTPLKTLMGFSVHLNVQLKFYNLPFLNKCERFYIICACQFIYKKIIYVDDPWSIINHSSARIIY